MMKNLAKLQQYERTFMTTREGLADSVHPFAIDRHGGFPGTVRTRRACR
ncbi:hypothetical protein [Paenibacillus xanthanilyticus]|uniref:Uncharacterized protein n=1 Tax=Paenibacillus xanthanilyticus TaxID=1783531 RepID=A0ABV8K462_9BACL